MPTPDLDERFRRWLKLIAEMHEGANFTANETIAWAPLRKALAECSVALVSTAGVHLKSQPAHDLLNPHGDANFRAIPKQAIWQWIMFIMIQAMPTQTLTAYSLLIGCANWWIWV